MDPKKRSLHNQLIAQISVVVIFDNLLFYPIIVWRFLVGPIYPMLSTFASVVDNTFKSWIGLCFTQMAIFKVKKTLKKP